MLPTRRCPPSVLLPGAIPLEPHSTIPKLELQEGHVLLFLDRVELVERLASNLLAELWHEVHQCRVGTGPQPAGPPGMQRGA
jgi:hypothetical protein